MNLNKKTGTIPVVSVVVLMVAAIIVFSLLILSVRPPGPECSPPYERVSGICCIDQNSNRICDSEEGACGDRTCQPGESCSSCQQDCGICLAVSSYSGAIDVLSKDERLSSWGEYAKNKSCEEKYFSLKNSVYYVAKVSVTKNDIKCLRLNHFSDMANLIRLATPDGGGIGLMSACNQYLTDVYNNELNGSFGPQYAFIPVVLEASCPGCKEFYAIHFGCFDRNIKENISTGKISPFNANEYIPYLGGFAVVDAETGNVYY